MNSSRSPEATARMRAARRPARPASVRFWTHVDKSGDCWTWTGHLMNTGYGQFSEKLPDGRNKKYLAHRYAYALAVGPIADDLVVCHRCDNRQCVRPDHLFVGTESDNARDMMNKGRGAGQFTPKDRCKRGHEFTAENTKHAFNGRVVGRQCRECGRIRDRASKARQRLRRLDHQPTHT